MNSLLTVRSHVRARGLYPGYPKRFPVPDDKVSWSINYPEYKTVEFTSDRILSRLPNLQRGPDPQDTKRLVSQFATRLTYETGGNITLDPATNRPLNPIGRTGLTGRGRLYRWGPNHAADPVVTRFRLLSTNNSKDNDLKREQPIEVVMIKRQDTGEWALPGGMMDPGETAEQTARREFEEEAIGEMGQNQQKELLDELFSNEKSRLLYRGYIDDPRNTDNSWMETSAVLFHLSPCAASLKLFAASDAVDVKWICIHPDKQELNMVNVGHRFLLELAIRALCSSK